MRVRRTIAALVSGLLLVTVALATGHAAAATGDGESFRRVYYPIEDFFGLPVAKSQGDGIAYPYGHRIDEVRRFEAGTLSSWSSSLLRSYCCDQPGDPTQFVRLLGGYLRADRIHAVSESGADPDAAATQVGWEVENLILFGDNPSGGRSRLIRWTGGLDPARWGDLQRFRYLNRGASPPRPPLKLTITIFPPSGPPEGIEGEELSCADTPLLCGGGGDSGVSLLKEDLYDTFPKSAFEEIKQALDTLRRPGGDLEGLKLIAGRSRSAEGSKFAESSISGLVAEFTHLVEETPNPSAPMATTRVDVASVSTYANSRALRTGARATHFEFAPSTPCPHQDDPDDSPYRCPGVFRHTIELNPPSGGSAGAGGRDQRVSGLGGDSGDGGVGPDESASPSDEAVTEPLLTSSGTTMGAVSGSTGGAAGTGGVSRDGGQAKDNGSEPSGPSDGDEPPVKPASVGPSDDGSILPWVGAAAAVALLALGLLGWRRLRGGAA